MKRIIAFYNKNKKTYLPIFGALVIFVLFLSPDLAFAAPAAPVGETGSVTRDINEIFDFLMKMTSAWLWPVIMMIGSLLDNDLIFGGAMGDRLLSVWVEIRNLVNIIFVLILLGIALYNVLGIGEEGGLPLSFKAAMPKFVLALIAVNFSFIGIKVLLDFTNVITGAVFALPTTAVEESVPIDLAMKKSICGTKSEATPMRPLFCKGEELNERAQSFFARLDRQNITIAYAVRFGRAVNLKFVNEGIKDIAQLGFNVVFNLILYIVYGVSFIVLFLVLLFRVVVLWVAVVMSPIIALGIVLPNLKELGGDTGKIKEKFVAHLIAPIKIGLTLAVGYIMLDGFQADKAIHGSILASSTMSSIDPNALPTDIADLQQLMIAIATVVILWSGVFSAAEGTTASVITNAIKGYGEGAAKWLGMTAPTLIPMIPVGSGKGKTKQSAQQIMGRFLGIKQGLENKYGTASTMYGGGSGGALTELNKHAENRNPSEYFSALKKGGSALLASSEGLKSAALLLTKLGDTEKAKTLAKMDPSQHAKIAQLLYGSKAAPYIKAAGFGSEGAFAKDMGTVPEPTAEAKPTAAATGTVPNTPNPPVVARTETREAKAARLAAEAAQARAEADGTTYTPAPVVAPVAPTTGAGTPVPAGAAPATAPASPPAGPPGTAPVPAPATAPAAPAPATPTPVPPAAPGTTTP